MRPQSIVMLVDGPSSGEHSGLRDLILRTLDPTRWRIVHCQTVEAAQDHFQVGQIAGLVPELVVLNVDVQRGWPFCSTLKKTFASVPVIVVSERLTKDVFNGHQKLDTRADAYHRLPDELEGLEISLGYFASHKSETGEEDEGSSPRLKARKSGRVPVPSGLLSKLEATVAEQARALEDARRQVEALAAERDAVADKNRRQVIELMALHPGASDGAEVASLRERIASLENKAQASTMLEEETRQLRASLAAARAEASRLQERPDAEALVTRLQGEVQALKGSEVELRQDLDRRAVELAALRTERDQLAQKQTRTSSPGMARPAVAALEEAREGARREAVEAADQLAKASVQLSTLATELKNSHERRLQAEEALRRAEARAVELEKQLTQRPAAASDELQERLLAAEDRAEAAERAWAAASARADQLQAFVQGAGAEIERANQEKKAIDDALAMSRRLMREYATDAARKAEELKEEQAQRKALAERADAAEKRAADLVQAAEFGASLVDSLEREVAELRSRPAGDPAEREVLQRNLEQLAAGYRSQQGEIERFQAELAQAGLKQAELEGMSSSLRAERDEALSQKASLASELLGAQDALALFEAQLEAASASRDEALAAKRSFDVARAELGAELDTARAAFEATQAALDAAKLELSQNQARFEQDHTEMAERQVELALEVEQEKRARQYVYEAMSNHAELVAQRFAAVREYAQKCEARLIQAEAGRTEVETRLEALLNEVQAQALRGEVPPDMELPLAPLFIDSDDDGEDDEDEGEGEAPGEAEVPGAHESATAVEILEVVERPVEDVPAAAFRESAVEPAGAAGGSGESDEPATPEQPAQV